MVKFSTPRLSDQPVRANRGLRLSAVGSDGLPALSPCIEDVRGPRVEQVFSMMLPVPNKEA
jgi:hypothetical protein